MGAQFLTMAIGEKIAWYRAKAEHSQESLAAASGLSRTRISELENNIGSPALDTLERLLAACNVSLSKFFSDDTLQTNETSLERESRQKLALLLSDSEMRRIAPRVIDALFHDIIRRRELPRAHDEPSLPESQSAEIEVDEPQFPVWINAPVYGEIVMGKPEETSQAPVERIEIMRSAIKTGQYILRARGDSMLPKFEPGDLLLLDNNLEARPGDYVAAMIDGRGMLKQLIHDKRGRPVLHALNRRYKDRPIKEGDDVAIQGVVVDIVRRKVRK